MTAPVLELAHLRHDYGQGPVLDLRDVTLPPGAYHVTGANGAGKTTLLAILATLLPPTTGRLEVLGLDPLTQGRQLRARLGYAAHDPSLHPPFTVAETLDLHARLHRRPPTASHRAAKAWGLTELLDHPVGQLSHGQARRVDLARATLHEPELLLLDEPTAGLDADAIERLTPHLATGERGSVISAGPGAPPHPAMRLLELRDGRLSPATEDATDREAPP